MVSSPSSAYCDEAKSSKVGMLKPKSTMPSIWKAIWKWTSSTTKASRLGTASAYGPMRVTSGRQKRR